MPYFTIALVSLECSSNSCSFQEKWQSNKIPRYFTYLDGISFLPSIFIFKSCELFFRGSLKIISSVLLAFNDILLGFNQLHKNFRSKFTYFEFFQSFTDIEKISIINEMMSSTTLREDIFARRYFREKIFSQKIFSRI